MRSTTRQRVQDRIAKLKARAKTGDVVAANNIAAEYRIMGRQRLAFLWWKKAAYLGGGDAWLEVGYCYHHGIGTRRNLKAAAEAYDSAIRSQAIVQYGLEEAMYHRAVLVLQSKSSRWARANASKLLRQASKDDDYPQATALLSTIGSMLPVQTCCCRRFLRRSLGGSAHCPLHRDAPSKAANRRPSRTAEKRGRSVPGS